MTFHCSRCGKQYIERQWLTKHIIAKAHFDKRQPAPIKPVNASLVDSGFEYKILE